MICRFIQVSEDGDGSRLYITEVKKNRLHIHGVSVLIVICSFHWLRNDLTPEERQTVPEQPGLVQPWWDMITTHSWDNFKLSNCNISTETAPKKQTGRPVVLAPCIKEYVT